MLDPFTEPLFIIIYLCSLFSNFNQPNQRPGGNFSHVGLRTCEGHGGVRPHGVDAVDVADVLNVGNRGFFEWWIVVV